MIEKIKFLILLRRLKKKDFKDGFNESVLKRLNKIDQRLKNL